MANRNQALINPKILAWARKRLFPTVEAASGPLKVPAQRLEKWERGEARPTFNQARRIADRLRIPFGYLYLSSPPPEAPLPLPDHRPNPAIPPSIDLIEVIHDAQRKQEWYREEMLHHESPPLPFAGQFNPESAFQDIANDIHATIGIGISTGGPMPKAAAPRPGFLADLVRRTEDAGILVLRSGVAAGNTHRKLNPAEFQGFAIADNHAPVIFINAQNSITAQTSTLAHQLTHIWINESGVCNTEFPAAYVNNVEKLCHRTAQEILHPEATKYGKLNNNPPWKQHAPKSANIPGAGNNVNHLSPILARNSKRFTTTLIVAMLEERIGYIDTAQLLNIKGRTLDSLSYHLLGVNLKDA